MIIDKGDIAVKSILENTGSGDLRLLEIGCGDGRITCGLHGTFKELVAIDPDMQSLKLAVKQYPEIDFRVGSGESLNFDDDSFDVVLFSLSLHHQNGVKALKETERILAPEGQVFILEPATDSPMSLLCNIFNNETVELTEAIETINNSGFSITSNSNLLTNWVFQDRYELYAWLYEYYNQKPNKIASDQVDIFLGKKLEESPLTIPEILAFTQLSPRI